MYAIVLHGTQAHNDALVRGGFFLMSEDLQALLSVAQHEAMARVRTFLESRCREEESDATPPERGPTPLGDQPE